MPAKKTTKKKVKTESAKDTSTEATTAPVTETTPVTETVSETAPESLDNKFHTEFSDLRAHFETTIQSAKDGLNLLKKLEKMVNKDLKKKKKKVLSGFAKPCKISNELSKFLGKSNDELIARTDVTKQITQYIKTNKLFDEKNKRNIKPDEKLKKVLNFEGIANKQITYFNLQKALKHNFLPVTN
jgi:chromatin remodeling complex protein RSC6